VFLDAVAHGSVISWQHHQLINLLGEYDTKKLQDGRNSTPKIDPLKNTTFSLASGKGLYMVALLKVIL
jgi:hypothetical protein